MSDESHLAKTHLRTAIQDIEAVGRHWPGAITRKDAVELGHLLEANGYRVLVHELPPEWEHVIALQEMENSTLKEIAAKRAVLNQRGLASGNLPK